MSDLMPVQNLYVVKVLGVVMVVCRYFAETPLEFIDTSATAS